MKFLSLLVLGFSLMSTGLLFSQQPQRTQCACKDCKCTPQSNCGCYANQPCSCGTHGPCSQRIFNGR